MRFPWRAIANPDRVPIEIPQVYSIPLSLSEQFFQQVTLAFRSLVSFEKVFRLRDFPYLALQRSAMSIES